MDCDPLARWYRWLEYAGFGLALEWRRLEFLPRLKRAKKILLLGEGDGRFLAALLRINPTAEIDYVDGSRKMLVLAERRARKAAENAPRVYFHRSEVLTWLQSRNPAGYDAICTHFFLDCFTQEQLEPLIREIACHAAPEACWVVSEFRYPDAGLAREWGSACIGMLYGFFRLCTGLRVSRLPEHDRGIAAAGFRRTQQVVAGWGILTSELWERD